MENNNINDISVSTEDPTISNEFLGSLFGSNKLTFDYEIINNKKKVPLDKLNDKDDGIYYFRYVWSFNTLKHIQGVNDKNYKDTLDNWKDVLDDTLKAIKEAKNSIGKNKVKDYEVKKDALPLLEQPKEIYINNPNSMHHQVRYNDLKHEAEENIQRKFLAEITKMCEEYIRAHDDLINTILKSAKNKEEKSNEEFDFSNPNINLTTGITEVKENLDVESSSHEEYQVSNEEAKPAKRKQVEDFILKYIGKIVTGKENVELYKNLFNSMNNKEFDKFMQDLRDGKKNLSVIIPNGSKSITADVENNVKLAKELGFDFFQRLSISNSPELPDHLTPNKYMVIKLPVRRAAQMVSKKISIPEDNKSIDMLSGQVTGKSKGSIISNPELQILLGLGLKDSLKELMKMRGGDIGESSAMNSLLFKQGLITQGQVESYSTGVVSKKTLKSYLNSMGIRSTL